MKSVFQAAQRVPPSVFDGVLALSLTLYVEARVGLPVAWAVAGSALLMTVPLLWRRRFPLLVFCVVVVGVLLTFVLHTAYDPSLIWAAIVASMVATYSIGVHGSRLMAALGSVLLAATAILLGFGGRPPPLPDTVVPYVILISPLLIGYTVRSRQQRAEAYRERALALEREQELVAHVVRTDERARIARELHDVLTHTVSVMMVQTTAARRILTVKPDQAQEALLAVEASGRDALAELRGFLGLLRDDTTDTPLAPQPSLAEIETLIERVREAGLPVELRIEGQPRPIPPDIDLAAYRVVQEALTNALKHSGLAHTEVVLDYAAAEMKVEVLDEGMHGRPQPYRSEGRGLIGMRERVTLLGGMLEAGPCSGRGYAVRASLPLVRQRP
jgi:signal transduction histidine kinase